MTTEHAEIRAFVAEHTEEFLADLASWLRIPSIGTDPAHAADVQRSAEWLADRLRAVGFPLVQIWPTPGQPAVYAEWLARPGAPTVLVYGHHDVQPVDPLGEWTSPPFEPVIVDSEFGPRLLGRGAIDDKGQVAFQLLGLSAHLAVTGAAAPAVNLKFLIEGEEESGSPHFGDLLRANRDRLACDVVIVSDTGIYSRELPSICIGMRGMVKGEFELRGADVDLHSGSFGGSVPNPAHVLARIVTALHDDDEHVTIPGFYDGVREPDATERELLDRLPFDEVEYLATSTAKALAGEAGWSTLERTGVRPTAEINGMTSGYTGAGHKTIVPSTASAKFSFRLVPNQPIEAITSAFRSWLTAQIPPGISVSLDFIGPGVRPFLTPLGDPMLAAVVRAMAAVFDREVLFTREGGSGPEADLAEVLDAPLIFLGFGLPDDRIHAPNEKADVPLLLKGAEAVALLWSDLGSGR
jgi:acetylornithine deacetylase/succinyl-diaminopimelate desuccinylase-like protein